MADKLVGNRQVMVRDILTNEFGWGMTCGIRHITFVLVEMLTDAQDDRSVEDLVDMRSK